MSRDERTRHRAARFCVRCPACDALVARVLPYMLSPSSPSRGFVEGEYFSRCHRLECARQRGEKVACCRTSACAISRQYAGGGRSCEGRYWATLSVHSTARHIARHPPCSAV